MSASRAFHGTSPIVRPRSRCPNCQTPIRWYDNIPLISWILLRARCRDCHQPIPLRYPLVELATAIWFAIQAGRLYTVVHFYFLDPLPGASSSYAPFAIIANLAVTILGFLLIGLIVMDWQTHLLPDAFTLTGIAIGLFLICTQAIFLGPTEDQVVLTHHSIQLTSPGGVTDHGQCLPHRPGSPDRRPHRLPSRSGAPAALDSLDLSASSAIAKGMGLGDVKLLAMIAAFLGFWPAILSLFFGVLGASIYGAIPTRTGRAGMLSKLAFGSFLGAGGLIAAQFGDRIIDAYSQLLR